MEIGLFFYTDLVTGSDRGGMETARSSVPLSGASTNPLDRTAFHNRASGVNLLYWQFDRTLRRVALDLNNARHIFRQTHDVERAQNTVRNLNGSLSDLELQLESPGLLTFTGRAILNSRNSWIEIRRQRIASLREEMRAFEARTVDALSTRLNGLRRRLLHARMNLLQYDLGQSYATLHHIVGELQELDIRNVAGLHSMHEELRREIDDFEHQIDLLCPPTYETPPPDYASRPASATSTRP